MEEATQIRLSSGRTPIPAKGVLLVHGGAGPQDPKGAQFLKGKAFLQTMLEGLGETQSPLGSTEPLVKKWSSLHWAEKAALSAVWKMESEPMLNAGFGASLQTDGHARVSASLMESERKVFSAVINARNIEHPSELSWWLQSQRHTVVDSTGAEFWREHLNIQSQSLTTSERLRRWVEYKREALKNDSLSGGRTGTVGAVALSADGKLAACTSTGGVGNEIAGRVGDAPTIAGNYCTSRAAISCTGIGEQIIHHALSPRIALGIEQGQPLEQVMRSTFELAAKRHFQFAAIALAYHPQDQSLEWAAASHNCELLWAIHGVKVSNSSTADCFQDTHSRPKSLQLVHTLYR